MKTQQEPEIGKESSAAPARLPLNIRKFALPMLVLSVAASYVANREREKGEVIPLNRPPGISAPGAKAMRIEVRHPAGMGRDNLNFLRDFALQFDQRLSSARGAAPERAAVNDTDFRMVFVDSASGLVKNDRFYQIDPDRRLYVNWEKLPPGPVDKVIQDTLPVLLEGVVEYRLGTELKREFNAPYVLLFAVTEAKMAAAGRALALTREIDNRWPSQFDERSRQAFSRMYAPEMKFTQAMYDLRRKGQRAVLRLDLGGLEAITEAAPPLDEVVEILLDPRNAASLSSDADPKRLAWLKDLLGSKERRDRIRTIYNGTFTDSALDYARASAEHLSRSLSASGISQAGGAANFDSLCGLATMLKPHHGEPSDVWVRIQRAGRRCYQELVGSITAGEISLEERAECLSRIASAVKVLDVKPTGEERRALENAVLAEVKRRSNDRDWGAWAVDERFIHENDLLEVLSDAAPILCGPEVTKRSLMDIRRLTRSLERGHEQFHRDSGDEETPRQRSGIEQI